MSASVFPILSALTALEVGKISLRQSLADHCSWRIGGPADLLIEVETLGQLSTLLAFVRQHQIPLIVIGQGSNLLFDDAGVRGVVLKLGPAFASAEISGNMISAGAGIWVPQLARMALNAGLSGIEHCCGIPGTLGGLVLMNGGSRRRGIGDNLRRLWSVDAAGSLRVRAQSECDFGYRSSVLQGLAEILVKVELECELGDKRIIRREMLSDLRERRNKFPRKIPNCGSVFLSSSEMHASVGPPGRIIEAAGLKGFRIGGAEVSQRHANFILNTGGARAADVLALIRHIRIRVRQQTGFDLCCEVRYVSPQALVMPADQVDF